MIVDSSVLVAILLREPERAHFIATLAEARAVSISAVTRLEAAIVMQARRRLTGLAALEGFLAQAGFLTIDFTAMQASLAIDAATRFGRGRHPAGLNFGDCAAYAAARASGEPLLFKGADFGQTDVRAHPASVILPA